MKNLYIYLAIVVLFSTSCENLLIKDLDLDETGFEKQLVVQSLLESGTDSIIVLVSENTSVLTSYGDITYLDADVTLVQPGAKTVTLEQGEDRRYYYFFDEPISEAGEYELVVENSKYGDSRTKAEVPQNVEIKDIDFKYNVGTDPLEMSEVSEVSFTIVDPPGTNYYEINLESMIGGIDTFVYGPTMMDTFYDARQVYAYPVFTQLDPTLSVSDYTGKIFIDGSFFDGKDYKVNIRYSLYNNGGETNEEAIRELLLLNFITHSENSYNYATSLDRYLSNQDFGLFSEPVSVFTNIDNGLGVFAGSAKKVYDFK